MENDKFGDVRARMIEAGSIDPDCGLCERYGMLNPEKNPSSVFAPSHLVRSRCESGKRPHCTCDTCF